ncbi:MAG: hypothetical protein J0H34_23855 [Rhizobiales bacterium]|jgi:hypothetical protein|nr:hypothetical protein [Hyphomicrobiales bacterium]
MTKTKTAAAALAEDDPFGVESVSGDDPFGDDFADVFAPPTPEEKLTLLAVALVEDPFATTRMDDGENPFGGASNLARYERASAAYLAACHAEDRDESDDEREEILRRIALYWLRRSKALWTV